VPFVGFETHRRGRSRGSWRFNGNIAGVAIDRACTVRQSENKIEGPCKNQIGKVLLHGEVGQVRHLEIRGTLRRH